MTTDSPFGALAENLKQRANDALERLMPGEQEEPARLHEAMRYAVFNGGKRVRAILVYVSAQAVDGTDAATDWPATAVELIHAYSLVHDDLPCMDDDDLRRGKPSCHRAFDEATALLAGDALQTQAFLTLTQTPSVSPQQVSEMVKVLAQASGSIGMAGGQAIDLAAVGHTLTIDELRNMHRRKTGALIRSSVLLGALCSSDVTPATLDQLSQYAMAIGLAFQIRDDVLDVESDTETLGKPQGADAAHDKPTYPALLGLDKAKTLANEQHEIALDALAEFGPPADPLRWLSEYIVTRVS